MPQTTTTPLHQQEQAAAQPFPAALTVFVSQCWAEQLHVFLRLPQVKPFHQTVNKTVFPNIY
jgi:hypothetical protein